MWNCLFFALLGYLSGSVLYAKIFVSLLTGKDIFQAAPDHNPGTSNAFLCGGIRCGIPALLCDILKGFCPVFVACFFCSTDMPLFSLVLLGPVIGHVWPIFYHFHGGKAIAVSFGVLLGLWPDFLWPAWSLAICYLFFSLVVVVSPNGYRSVLTFACALCLDKELQQPTAVLWGMMGIMVLVSIKHISDLAHQEQHPTVHFFSIK